MSRNCLQVVRGLPLTWQRTFDGVDGNWTVTYNFRGCGQGINVDGVWNVGGFTFTADETDTVKLSPGEYTFQAIAVNGQSREVDSGMLTVSENLGLTNPAEMIDTRSQFKIALDNIRMVIAGKATTDVLQYSIKDRQLTRYSITELLELEKHFAALVARENRRKSGRGIMRSTKMRILEEKG